MEKVLYQLRKNLGPGVLLFLIILFQNEALLKLLQYNRDLIINGSEYWRLFTGHFVHWSYEHLFWDLLTFSILSIIFNKIDKLSFWIILLVSPFIFSLVILYQFKNMNLYRGLSGIDLALFANASLYFISRIFKNKNIKLGVFGIITFLFMILKVVYEIILDKTVFVSKINFIPLPHIHLAGIIFGAFLFFIMIFIGKLIK